MDDLIESAILAMHAYQKYQDITVLPPQWERITTSDDMLGVSKTSFAASLYRYTPPPGQTRYAVAFCGFSDAGDIKNALEAGFAGLPDQTPEAIEFTRQTAQKYGIEKSQLSFVGHSLGGYLAKSVGWIWGGTGIAPFNSPGFKKGDLEKLQELAASMDIVPCQQKPPVRTVNSKYDIVGMWGYHPGEVFEVETACNHHNMREIIGALAALHPTALAFANAADHESTPVNKLRMVLRAICDKIGQSDTVQHQVKDRFRGNTAANCGV